jgi:hypothetical protein
VVSWSVGIDVVGGELGAPPRQHMSLPGRRRGRVLATWWRWCVGSAGVVCVFGVVQLRGAGRMVELELGLKLTPAARSADWR